MKRGQAYPGAPSSKAYESAIPIILIIVLAIFIAGKIGLVDLHGIPVVGSLFPAPTIKIGVVGKISPYLKEYLIAEDFRQAGVNYISDIPQEVIYPGVLDQFDIIILQGEKYCDRTARKVIADAVKAGKKLIVVGDACTKVHDDETVRGWEIGIGSLGDVMPVSYAGVMGGELVPSRIEAYPGGRFKCIDRGHPICPAGQLNFDFTGALMQVIPKTNSEPIAMVTSFGGVPTAPATYAIIESKGLLMGKTMYFAYDPGMGPRNMLLNALLYLRGAKG